MMLKRTEAAQSIVSSHRRTCSEPSEAIGCRFHDIHRAGAGPGSFPTDEEVRGIGVLFLIAGLDTVAAALGFDLAYLARNPEDQESLRREPTRIATAVEELLRAYSTVQIIRVATKDVDFEGVSMRKGDFVSCATMIANRDPRRIHVPGHTRLGATGTTAT
ncbi:cytochrome P450 [Rhizobium beringeri]